MRPVIPSKHAPSRRHPRHAAGRPVGERTGGDYAPDLPGRRNTCIYTPPTAEQVLDASAPIIAYGVPAEGVPGEGFKPHPYIPEGSITSGVTLGFGWDASAQTPAQLESDWAEIPQADREKLAKVLSLTGPRAAQALPQVKSITITKELATKVFRKRVLPRYYAEAKGTYPGLSQLPLEVQIAVLSMHYNRGPALHASKSDKDFARKEDRLSEKRTIRAEVAKYVGAQTREEQSEALGEIAIALDRMKRLWAGQKQGGLLKRREHEAKLVKRARLQLGPCQY